MNKTTPDGVLKRLPLKDDIIFRLARRDDLPKLEWMGEYTHFRRVIHYTFREQQTGQRMMLLADFNGYPIGQIFIFLKQEGFLFSGNKPRGYLYSLRVMAPFRGLGIGTELLLEAEKLLLARSMTVATIAAAKDNPNARRLYERIGYQVYAEDEGYWSYINHKGEHIEVHEPCWMLEKNLVR